MGRSNIAGARELKTRLGAYLRQVRQGATIVVTERGEPVAELRPFRRAKDGSDAGWARLIASGAVTRESNAPLATFRPLGRRRKDLGAAIFEGREDRF
jgi:prevent-host-death family protein